MLFHFFFLFVLQLYCKTNCMTLLHKNISQTKMHFYRDERLQIKLFIIKTLEFNLGNLIFYCYHNSEIN